MLPGLRSTMHQAMKQAAPEIGKTRVPSKSDKMPEETNSPELADTRKALLDLAVESWRFGKLFNRMLAQLDAGEPKRYQARLNWFQKRLKESLLDAGMELVNMEGQEFDEGMAATPLNMDEFAGDDKLIIDQMLEPTIRSSEGSIVRTGTVTLKKVE